MTPHALELDRVRLSLGGRLLMSVSATIAAGEVLTIMGPSGSGKSTLLAFISGFLSSAFEAEGRVVLDGKDITGLAAEHSRVGLLFQDPLLFPHLSVAGNLSFGLPGSIRKRQQHVETALTEIGLADYGQRDPATLSGGQQARVSLMRLLLSEPSAVLLDEPFSRLDSALRHEMRTLVFERLRERGLPSVLVTHDQADADAAGGRVISLD